MVTDSIREEVGVQALRIQRGGNQQGWQGMINIPQV